MTIARDMAAFATGASFGVLSEGARAALKLRILDAVGCAFGALDAAPMAALEAQLEDFGGRPLCTLVGGGRTAPDRAALFNGALVRYLDFNDSYLAPGETCHPSDNLSSVLAAAEYAGADGRTLMVALAVAYQVQCRLSDVAPVRARGFDHTTQGACAVAAGVSRALGLDVARAANAIAIAATAFQGLRVTRTGALSQWKGLAYPHTAFAATHATFLAARGITGPSEAFEGNKGFMDTVTGPFAIDWRREGLDAVTRTSVKRFDAEVHAQSAIEGVLELRESVLGCHRPIERIEVDVFDVAYRIIGGGEEGDKSVVRTKEQADHSLPYMLAVALLDGCVMPEQYASERILRDDVQSLLRRVVVRPDPELSARFPREHGCRVRIVLDDGRVLATAKRDYSGYVTHPMTWNVAREKFEKLASSRLLATDRARLVATIDGLEASTTADLCAALSPGAKTPGARADTLPEMRP